MPVLYPRTCDSCASVYQHDSSFAKHRTDGRCAKRALALQNPQTANVINNTTINHMNTNNDEETKALQEQVMKLQLQVEAFQARENNVKLPLLDAEDEYIYVIQERIAMELLIPVYKPGVTGEIHKRTGSYAKGSKLLFCRVFKDARSKERALHLHLKTRFKARPDFGFEHVEGDVNDIMNEITAFFSAAT